MKITYEASEIAWEPITPAGVASFARAKAGRLWVVQSIVACLVATAVVWFLHARWYPAVQVAVKQLPPAGEIRGGQLLWRGAARAQLAEGGYLAIEVNLEDMVPLDRTADVDWVFGVSSVRVYSLLGYVELNYPDGWVIAFNRRKLEPWLGAWEPVVLGMVFASVWLGLMVTWQVLAAVYMLPVRLVCFYANKEMGWGGSWRLAGAALLPAALFNAAAIVAYGFHLLDPLRFLVATVMHFVVGWVYVVVSPLFLRGRGEGSGKENPFSRGDEEGRGPGRNNIFRG